MNDLFKISILSLLLTVNSYAFSQQPSDTIKTLQELEVRAKSNSDRLRESSYSATAVEVSDKLSTTADITSLINKASGVKVRREGGLGSDFDLSVNGMSGNAVRYFIDGIPLESLGAGMSLSSLPRQ